MFGFVGFVGKVIDLVLTRVAGKHIELSLDKKQQAAKAFVRFHESVTDLQAVLDEFLKYSESFIQRRNFNLASSGKSVGDIERHRVVSMRNCRNFLQVESKDLC